MMRNNKRLLKRRVTWLTENKVNAFSPTISPAPKATNNDEIESVEKAIEYYFKNGVTEIVAQKKYMGSYCDIYLHENHDETYFISRNGHKIEHIDLNSARLASKELHGKFDWKELKIVIIQSEMMPWSILGNTLIDYEFGGYADAHNIHMKYLKDSSLYRNIAMVKKSSGYIDFVADQNSMSKKEFNAKHANHVRRQYQALTDIKIEDLNTYERSIELYKKQVDHYGVKGEIYFKPFNILKKIYKDGKELIPNDNKSYGLVNDDVYLHANIEAFEDIGKLAKKWNHWFNELSSEMEEGIIIKPAKSFIKNIAPALKVRNRDYLTMIYGINFQTNFKRYLRRRNISDKLRCSINDWMLNWEILKIPYEDIHQENYQFKNLMCDRILGEEIVKRLDPRL